MLRKRKATQETVEMMEKKRRAVTTNDMNEESKLKEDLENYEDAGDF
jgi:hypothetical protein